MTFDRPVRVIDNAVAKDSVTNRMKVEEGNDRRKCALQFCMSLPAQGLNVRSNSNVPAPNFMHMEVKR